MRELSVQAANDTNVAADRTAIQTELTDLSAEITRISDNTQFNTKKLLDSSLSAVLQVGANAAETITVTVGTDMDAAGLAVNALTVASTGSAASCITLVNSAIAEVSTTRSGLGAKQNRLEHTISNLDTAAENLQASESRIRDVDMAKEMMTFTKNNILNQAATAMLAQANQAPQGVLQLLR
jgi:flagellin